MRLVKHQVRYAVAGFTAAALTTLIVQPATAVPGEDRPDVDPAELARSSSVVSVKPGLARLGVGARSTVMLEPTGPSSQAIDEDLCTHLVPGPGGHASVPVDFSGAAALVRQFGVTSAYAPSDLALDAALEDDSSLTSAGVGSALEQYVAPLDDACTMGAGSGDLGPAKVTYDGNVAVVRPGTGQLTLARRTSSVVLDLRDLPAAPGLEAALRRAVAPALARPVAPPLRWLRSHTGPVDEALLPFNVYSTSVVLRDDLPLPATGARDLPLVLLTSPRSAPETAALVGTLRAAGRAWIVGSDVHSTVAESEWRGVADAGIGVRTGLLEKLTGRTTILDLAAQMARQDDPNDPTTASYRRTFGVGQGVRRLVVTTDGRPGADTDLFLLHDADDNGSFAFPGELVGVSATESVDERIELGGQVPAGDYEVWVHGWYVPAPFAPFQLTAEATTAETWPDVIEADDGRDPATAGEAAAIARELPRVPGPMTGPASRPAPVTVDPFGQVRDTPADRGAVRAGLLTAHGLARLFFRYFPTVGDTIDARLIEALDLVDDYDGLDRDAARNILRRFGEALNDGHQFVFNRGASDTVGYLPLALEEIGGLPVVHASLDPAVNPGDTILAIDGRPASEIVAEEMTRSSPPTPGYRYDVAMRELAAMEAAETLLLADPDGVTRTVSIDPHPVTDYFAAWDAVSGARESGGLADLGAEDLYYLNLDTAASPTTAAARAALAEATSQGARGLILDMRGYPGGVNHYEIAMRLIPTPFLSPIFEYATYTGPDVMELRTEQYQLPPLSSPSWSGPIVLLTGPHAVSAAENFMQMLVGAGRISTVVGQRSAGTNGNITSISLPGALAFSYTGMEVRNPDGSVHHGVGITPDVFVPRAAVDYRDGVDRDLLAGIDAMRAVLGD